MPKNITLKFSSSGIQSDIYYLTPEILTKLESKEIEGLPAPSPKLDKIILKQINQATKKRQQAISKLEDKDPKWVKTALVESFLLANCGKFGEKIMWSTITPIQEWVRQNLSDKEIQQFEKKFGL